MVKMLKLKILNIVVINQQFRYTCFYYSHSNGCETLKEN